jgi:hydrogenase maturation protease
VLVIAIGNDLRGDDGAGPAVADAVARRLPRVRTLTVQQLLPELADDVAQADAVIFVDASAAVDGVTVREVTPQSGAGHSHIATPAAILALCRDAYGKAPTVAWQVEVPASRFDLGAGLSADARRGVDEAVDRIAALVAAS